MDDWRAKEKEARRKKLEYEKRGRLSGKYSKRERKGGSLRRNDWKWDLTTDPIQEHW
ncbi:hypothetical protein AGMMS49992_34180 [Clostridia bacterium]|nr:hypothetical protein AGMMS49992_34180 [Clostridia bacterium]